MGCLRYHILITQMQFATHYFGGAGDTRCCPALKHIEADMETTCPNHSSKSAYGHPNNHTHATSALPAVLAPS